MFSLGLYAPCSAIWLAAFHSVSRKPFKHQPCSSKHYKKTGLNSTIVTILLCNSRSFLLGDSYLGIIVPSVCTNYCYCSEEVLLASCLCFHG